MMYELMPFDVALFGVVALEIGGAVMACSSRAVTLISGALLCIVAGALIYAGVAHV